MRTRLNVPARPALLAMLAASAVTTACSHPGPSTLTSAPRSGGPAVLVAEVERELAAARDTRYQHATRVEEGTGTYWYDCSGMVDYALSRVLPRDLAALPTSTSVRPLAGDIEQYLDRGSSGTVDGWQAVLRVDNLRPGDVVAWQVTEDSTSGDTGHVMVVLAEPAANPARPDEWLVAVADSTLSPHARDSRTAGSTGLGTGTIGLVAAQGGHPTAFYWRGGRSEHAKETEIALGRPD